MTVTGPQIFLLLLQLYRTTARTESHVCLYLNTEQRRPDVVSGQQANPIQTKKLTARWKRIMRSRLEAPRHSQLLFSVANRLERDEELEFLSCLHSPHHSARDDNLSLFPLIAPPPFAPSSPSCLPFLRRICAKA